MEVLPLSNWIFLGQDDGTVAVFDPTADSLSSYVIPCNAKLAFLFSFLFYFSGPLLTLFPQIKRDEENRLAVVGLQGHPEDPGVVLIGRENGTVVVWNLRKRHVVQSFNTFEAGLAPLTAVCWHPTGRVFATAFENGRYAIWDAATQRTPLFHGVTESDHPDDLTRPRQPIFKLRWFVTDNESLLLIAGGEPDADHRGIFVLRFGGVSTTDLKPKKPSHLQFEREIVDFELTSSSPWYLGGRNPTSVIVLFADGRVEAHDVQKQTFDDLDLPGSLTLHDSPIICVDFAVFCPEVVITEFGQATRKLRDGPINGGKSVDPFRTSYHDVILTAHQNGMVHLWDGIGSIDPLIPFFDISYYLFIFRPFFFPLVSLRLIGSVDTRLKGEESAVWVTRMHLDHETKTLIVCKSDGHLFHYHFRPAGSPSSPPTSRSQSLEKLSSLSGVPPPLQLATPSPFHHLGSAPAAAEETPDQQQSQPQPQASQEGQSPNASPASKGSTMSKAAGRIISALSFCEHNFFFPPLLFA